MPQPAPHRTTDAPQLVLALDTATAATGVAVVAGPPADSERRPDVLAADRDVAANRHGEVLAPLVRRCLDAAGVPAPELGLIAVGTGPGPFTGLRVGLMTARALGDALGVECRGVCSLDVIAAAVADRAPGRGFVVATDARRREVYWAAYDERGVRTEGPAVERPADLADRLGRLEVRPLLAGAGAVLYRDVFAGFEVDGDDPYPDAARLAALALDPARSGPPQPLYLRRPDATPPGPRKLVTRT